MREKHPDMSKNQLKRIIKSELWELKKVEIKAKKSANPAKLEEITDEKELARIEEEKVDFEVVKKDGKVFKVVSRWKKNKGSLNHLMRFNQFSNDPDDPNKPTGNGLSKQQKQKLFKDLC